MKRPIVLTIIDGLGLSKNKEGNAWAMAQTPILDSLMEKYPNTKLKASGKAVGLPKGQIGNSEVGHLSIGAGEIVYTGLALIQKAIDNNSFFKNEAILKSINYAKSNNGTVHVMGLLSPGGVHSNQDHLFKIMEMIKQNGVTKASMHLFTDGRDVAPRSVKEYLTNLYDKVGKYDYPVASISGRLYAMDRDQIWEKTQKAFTAIRGEAINNFDNSLEGILKYIDNQYAKDLNDEFIECAVNNDSGINFMQDNDSAIFFNFRPDRARQLAHLIVGSNLYQYENPDPVKDVPMTIMMPYDGINNADIAFSAMEVKTPLGKVISQQGLKQLRIAETQKYAHVTFFMDGGKDISYPGEDRILVDSKKVDNFKTAPHMSAEGISDKLIANLAKYDLVIMNYANPDMVGHTGDLNAAIDAVNFTDVQIGKVFKAVEEIGGTLFVTADHGNAEIMIDDQGNPVTKHTVSDVPFIMTDNNYQLKGDGSLCNIAPTILEYMGIAKGESMNHDSLLIK